MLDNNTPAVRDIVLLYTTYIPRYMLLLFEEREMLLRILGKPNYHRDGDPIVCIS